MTSVLRFFGRQIFVTPTPATADLTGQVGIVTGSNAGLGLGVAGQLLKLNIGTVILAVRSLDKGEAAKASLLATYPKATIHVWALDLESYDSVTAFAQRCTELERLDFAILNAAVSLPKFQANASTGHEASFQVNVLSTALLSLLLLPVLARTARSTQRPGKLTIVGSEVSEWATFRTAGCDPWFAALDDPKRFDSGRYMDTKRLVNYFVRRVTTLVPADKVIINVVNPGLVHTGLTRHADGAAKALIAVLKAGLARTVEVGARPLVKAAVDTGKESHGQFYSDNGCWSSLPGVTSKELEDKLWRELMQELKFANVEAALAEVQ